jgi:putative endonuclease
MSDDDATPESPETPAHLALGRLGEKAAVRYLWNRGFRILETNYKSGRKETDIIAEKAGRIHFVEVKTRSSESLGRPEERVDTKKRELLRDAAQSYLAEFRHPPSGGWQFDVIAILAKSDGVVSSLEYQENIF